MVSPRLDDCGGRLRTQPDFGTFLRCSSAAPPVSRPWVSGHRCSRRVGFGDYSVRREGRLGPAKVCRARNPFSSEGRTIACPRRRAGPRRRTKTRYLSIPSLCARASAGFAGPSGRRQLLLRQLTGGTGNHADYDRAAGGSRRKAWVEVEGSATCGAEPRARIISVARPDRCTASAVPCFRDGNAGRRLPKGTRNLRLRISDRIARLFGSYE